MLRPPGCITSRSHVPPWLKRVQIDKALLVGTCLDMEGRPEEQEAWYLPDSDSRVFAQVFGIERWIPFSTLLYQRVEM